MTTKAAATDEAAYDVRAGDGHRTRFLPPTGAPPPATHRAAAAKPVPRTLLSLPPEVIVLVFGWLDARSLARVAASCSVLYRDQPRPMNTVEEALRERASARGHTSPGPLPEGVTSRATHLAWLEHRREEAWMPVAACSKGAFFAADGGRLMGYVTSHHELPPTMARTPTLLPSMAGIHIRGVSSGLGFSAAVSAAGHVYTWGSGTTGRLGHGDDQGSLLPKQVRAMTEHQVLSVAAGTFHCLAVTERCEVFSWGWNRKGQCGHEGAGHTQLLPRRIEALMGVRARSASAGGAHSLVVTEDGALYSFGYGGQGQLGHGSHEDVCSPKRVDELRHVRIATAAAGGTFSLALAGDDTVFSWGCNAHGRLGLGRSGGAETSPQRIEALREVRAVAAAEDTGCAVTATGELYTWGNGYHGRLGHGDDAEQHVPKRVEALRDEWVVAVSSSNWHTTAVSRDGGVFGWFGWGAHALLGADSNARPRRYAQIVCLQQP